MLATCYNFHTCLYATFTDLICSQNLHILPCRVRTRLSYGRFLALLQEREHSCLINATATIGRCNAFQGSACIHLRQHMRAAVPWLGNFHTPLLRKWVWEGPYPLPNPRRAEREAREDAAALRARADAAAGLRAAAAAAEDRERAARDQAQALAQVPALFHTFGRVYDPGSGACLRTAGDQAQALVQVPALCRAGSGCMV